jgi:hypothetical protein
MGRTMLETTASLFRQDESHRRAGVAAIMEYQTYRRKQGAANATINRELAVLSCAFTLGYEQTPRRVAEKLHFTRLPEPKGRQGFVEEKQYRALAAKCDEPYMRAMLASPTTSDSGKQNCSL